MAEIKIVPGTVKLIKMTDAEYFSDQYKDYISNSKLGLFNADEGGSEEKYEAGFKEEYSESFELGSVVHAMLLQPEFYHIADIHKPTGKLGLFALEVFKLRSTNKNMKLMDAMKTASINVNYYSKQFTEGRIKNAIKGSLDFYLKRMHFQEQSNKETIFLSSPLKTKYEECIMNISSSKITETLYPEGLLGPHEYFNEYAILCEVDIISEDDCVRLKLKGKLDNFTLNHEEGIVTLNDLKTTGKNINYFMGNYVNIEGESVWYNGSFQKYHYYRQMGMYLFLLQYAIQELYGYKYKSKVNMLVIETIPEYRNKVYSVNGKYINAGIEEFKKLLILLSEWNKKKNPPKT